MQRVDGESGAMGEEVLTGISVEFQKRVPQLGFVLGQQFFKRSVARIDLPAGLEFRDSGETVYERVLADDLQQAPSPHKLSMASGRIGAGDRWQALLSLARR
jgi:hypothetical protein